MSSAKTYPVTDDQITRSHLDQDSYQALYTQSIECPEEFWAEQAGQLLHWHEP